MTLATTMQTAVSALGTAQRALSLIAHNVSNANTPGYSRQIHNQEAIAIQGRGTGVVALDPERVADAFLTTEMRSQRNAIGQSTAAAEVLDQVQDRILGAPGEGDAGLGQALSDFTVQVEKFIADPKSSANALSLVKAGEALTSSIAQGWDMVQQIRGDLDRQVGLSVDAVNRAIAGLDRINLEVARNGITPDLADERDKFLSELSELLPVTTTVNNNDTISVYTSGGQPLLEQSPRVVNYTPLADVSGAATFGPITLYASKDIDPASGDPRAGATGVELVTGGLRMTLTAEQQVDAVADQDQQIVSMLTGGKIQGLIEARDSILPEFGDQLNEYARLLTFAVNRASNGAVAIPPPDTLSGSRTDHSLFNAASNSGTAYFSVVDKDSSATSTTFAVNLAGASPADIAAQIDTGLGGLGTASIDADGRLQIAVNDATTGIAVAEGTSAVALTDATGRTETYALSHYFGLNDFFVSEGRFAAQIAVSDDLHDGTKRPPSSMLTIETTPSLTGSLGSSGDNRGAVLLADALQTRETSIGRGSMPSRNVTVSEYLTEFISNVAAAGTAADQEVASRTALLENLEARVGEVAGVNVDEELSRLVIYQQNYSVAARIITVTNELFDELFAIAR